MLTVSGPPWLFPTVAPSGFFSPKYTGSAQSMHTEVHPWHSTLSTEAGRTVTHVALVCVSPSSVTVSSPPLPATRSLPGSLSHVVPSAGPSRQGSDPSFLLSFALDGLFSVAVTEHLWASDEASLATGALWRSQAGLDITGEGPPGQGAGSLQQPLPPQPTDVLIHESVEGVIRTGPVTPQGIPPAHTTGTGFGTAGGHMLKPRP